MGTKQHFLPASIIGNFSNQSSGPGRKRPIWVKILELNKIYESIPERVANVEGFYDLEKEGNTISTVDDMWTKVEKDLPNEIKNLEQSYEEPFKATSWVTLVQYVAHLFVRGPDFNSRYYERIGRLLEYLDHNIRDKTNMARIIEVQHFYAPIMYADWVLVHNTSDLPIIQNDIGYSMFQDIPTRTQGFVIPLSKDIALMMAQGERTKRAIAPLAYVDNDWHVIDLRHSFVDKSEISSLNQSIADFAVKEFYGATKESVHINFNPNPDVRTGFTPFLLIPGDVPNYTKTHYLDLFKVISIISQKHE
jgi:hypothetical protein